VFKFVGVLFVVFSIASCSSESVEFPVNDNETDESTETTGRSLSATLYRPSGELPSPAVVLMHGCAGVLSKHRDWAEELADWGYTALIVDSFSPRGVKRICEAQNRVWARFDRLRPQDAQAALSYLRSLPEVDANRIGLMGWSYGGTTTLSLMEESLRPEDVDFSAAVAIYPSCWQFLQSFQTRE
jgi:dienelactone hydrolase